MFLFEFNNLDLKDKRGYIFNLPANKDKGRLLLFRDEGDLKYSLWDCDSFLVEMCAANGKPIKIEGIELTDDRINLYLDWMDTNKDDPKYQLRVSDTASLARGEQRDSLKKSYTQAVINTNND